MATKTKPDSAQVTKQRRGASPATETIQGKRTTGTIGRSSNGGGKSSVATASSVEKTNVPSYLRPTQSSRSESPKTKPSPTLNRRQSIDRPPQTAQLQRILFSAGPRSPAVKTQSATSSPRTTSSRPPELLKSLSSSSRSRPTNSRPAPELMKSKTMPKPVASSRPGSATGSTSRLGPTGKTLKKSSVPDLPLKRQNVSDFNDEDHIITAQAEPEAAPEVIVEEEKKATSPPPPPQVEDEPVEHDVIVVEEDHVQDEQQHQEEEEGEEVVVSTIKEEEPKEIHREAAIPDSPTDIESSEEKPVEEEKEEETNHDIEFHQEEESYGGCIDVGESYGEEECGGSSKPPPHELEGNHEGELELKSDDTADAEENPNMALKETEAASMSQSQSQSPQPKISKEEELTKIAVISRPALNAQRSSQGKKESPMYNDVIEETASKLLEKRKNKVRALVGAFETVISLQE